GAAAPRRSGACPPRPRPDGGRVELPAASGGVRRGPASQDAALTVRPGHGPCQGGPTPPDFARSIKIEGEPALATDACHIGGNWPTRRLRVPGQAQEAPYGPLSAS